MSYRLRALPLVALLATFTLAATTRASAPAGVWGRLDQVTFDPNAKAPTLRIDGVFIVANQKPDFMAYPGYSVPQYGYMFYDCPVLKDLPMCLMQWNELLAVAGKDDNCRGWGNSANNNNGTVRPEGDPELKPDAYPIALGVTPGFSPCEAITMWQVDNPPPETPAETSTGEPGSTGAVDTTGGEPPGTTTSAETGTPGSTGGEPPGSTGGEPGETGKPGETGTPETSGDPVTSGPTEAGGGTTNATNATNATSDASTTATATDGQSDDKGGCACNSDGPGDRNLTALALLGGLALLRRRPA